MGRQSSRLIFGGQDHKGVFYNGLDNVKMYQGSQLIWEKQNKHPRYSLYTMVTPTLPYSGVHIVDEVGERIIVNEGAAIHKSAAYIKWQHDSELGVDIPDFTIACTGENITSVRFEGYHSYQGEIIYTPADDSLILIFPMTEGPEGIWTYKRFTMILHNFMDAQGKNMMVHSIGTFGEDMRIFSDLSEMKAWLVS